MFLSWILGYYIGDFRDLIDIYKFFEVNSEKCIKADSGNKLCTVLYQEKGLRQINSNLEIDLCGYWKLCTKLVGTDNFKENKN